ncbi:MAG: T9SS type A sorting domain-containing protein [Bacteroidota bacterium]|nr:T9SS type A sorting domain-containing protein [Bacteroidota bacterium]
MKLFFGSLFLICGLRSVAQFAPPAGQLGTSAMHMDSSVFVAWASGCSIVQEYQDISNPSAGYANVGDNTMAVGIAGANGTVSLGDGGSAVLTFDAPIMDGPGADFAVFENSFSDDFLELAFVEASSDGINFFRFPAISNTQDSVQVGSFGYTDATKINNLAGKYRYGFGTPFDLQDLNGISGLDVNAITHVKIIDVVGNIDPLYATYDSQGNKVNDPWPTPFGSSGFDLDALGVIHTASVDVKNVEKDIVFTIFPNPVIDNVTIVLGSQDDVSVSLKNSVGQLILFQSNVKSKYRFDLTLLEKGLYFLEVNSQEKKSVKKIIVQ